MNGTQVLRAANAWLKAFENGRHTDAEWRALVADAPKQVRHLVELVRQLAVRLPAAPRDVARDPIVEPKHPRARRRELTELLQALLEEIDEAQAEDETVFRPISFEGYEPAPLSLGFENSNPFGGTGPTD
jgi:hypothetical protein